MTNDASTTGLVIVDDIGTQSPIEAVAGALANGATPDAKLSATTHVALRDPFVRQQLAELHQHWQVRPRASQGVLARIRTRLAWWLLGPELEQTNRTHATLVRLIDSLVVHLDEERSARRRLEERRAYWRDEL